MERLIPVYPMALKVLSRKFRVWLGMFEVERVNVDWMDGPVLVEVEGTE
jgi:hypothetical protein